MRDIVQFNVFIMPAVLQHSVLFSHVISMIPVEIAPDIHDLIHYPHTAMPSARCLFNFESKELFRNRVMKGN